jgi:hypothetical protein
MGVEAKRGRILARQLDEIGAAGGALLARGSILPVASLTPMMRGSLASSPMVSGVMSTTERPGML